MNLKNVFSISLIALLFVFPTTFESNVNAGVLMDPVPLPPPSSCGNFRGGDGRYGIGCPTSISSTDHDPFQLYAFFDLRDRESFFQVTNVNNPDGSTFNENITIHVQVFNVGNDCIENNFFDVFTPNDTHVYNLRDILTNDGDPSGVVLPENAYGVVVVSQVISEGGPIVEGPGSLIGNFRVVDDLGYEYRTNAAGISNLDQQTGFGFFGDNEYSFNYNTKGGVTLSDVVGIQVNGIFTENGEVDISNITDNFVAMDIDIYDLNEVPFSCRNIIFSCVDQDNPRLQELLEFSGDASVASFEYGINNSILHSKGGELLCPGNIISEGIVTLDPINIAPTFTEGNFFIGYVGLNNGNGRGSMDSFWAPNNRILGLMMGPG